MRINFFKIVVFIIAIVALDQISKLLILQNMHEFQSINILPFFNIVLVYNTGAAFSFLANAGGWQNYFFIIVTIIAMGLIIYLMINSFSNNNNYEVLALSFILGGAIGNLIDRVRLGKVVDFLDFYWQNTHYPAFNLADSAITCGVLIMIYAIIFSGKKSNLI